MHTDTTRDNDNQSVFYCKMTFAALLLTGSAFAIGFGAMPALQKNNILEATVIIIAACVIPTVCGSFFLCNTNDEDENTNSLSDSLLENNSSLQNNHSSLYSTSATPDLENQIQQPMNSTLT